MKTCPAVEVNLYDRLWFFCPSIGASGLFLGLFSITALVHLVQAVHYRKIYCLVIFISALWQVLTYFFRTLSILHYTTLGAYTAWFLLISVAPLWTNAFVYMIFGRMVWNYSRGRVWRIRAWAFGVIFVLLDVVSFIVQVWGALRASGKDPKPNVVLQGLHIYMGGIGIQFFFLLVFCVFAAKLFFGIRKNIAAQILPPNVMHLFYALILAVVLISVRIIFRLCEYAQGFKSGISNKEAYQYCLDSLPMLVALVAFNIIHPGRVMHGKASNMPPAWKQSKVTPPYDDQLISDSASSQVHHKPKDQQDYQLYNPPYYPQNNQQSYPQNNQQSYQQDYQQNHQQG